MSCKKQHKTSSSKNNKMSRNTKNTSQEQKKFCKVCQDAGKAESEYRSHFIRETREPNSRVVCPTLLVLECRYCFKKGHTVKYCLVLKEKDREPSRQVPRPTEKSKYEENPKGNSTNIYNVLDSVSEDEDSWQVSNNRYKAVFEQVILREEYPALSSAATIKPVSSNYAAALSKPVVPKSAIFSVEKQTHPVLFEVKAAPWASGVQKVSTKKSWAVWSDSEDED